MPDELANRRILVPPSRVGRSVLADALGALGATVVEFPRLAAAPPPDLPALDAAAEDALDFPWIVFSGAQSVEAFFARPAAVRLLQGEGLDSRTVALGAGTVDALVKRGCRPHLAPRLHTPAHVIDALGALTDVRVLLVREASAEDALPRALAEAGARVRSVAGYSVDVDAGPALVADAFDAPLDLLAFANPTSARILARAFHEADLDRSVRLAGVPVAAAGPLTAEAARRYGFPADLVAAGRIADLMREIRARMAHA